MSLQSGPIPYTTEYLRQLKALVPNKTVLATAGYVIDELSHEALELKKRCAGCGKPMSKFRPRKNEKQKKDVAESVACDDQVPPSCYDTATVAADSLHTSPRMRCRYHSGILKAKVWSCCGAQPLDAPCASQETHSARVYKDGEIETLWQYYWTPSARPGFPYRHAVAIDCEMGTAVSGDSELIRVTLVDFFSGQVLIDKLVYPDVPMQHLNTRYSGVRSSDLLRARHAGSCFLGRNKARDSILQYVGPDTLVIGHSAQNDLTSLRWIHVNVVDTFLLESAALAKEVEKAATETSIVSLQLLSLQDCSARDPASDPVGVPASIPTNDPAIGSANRGKKKDKGSGRLSLKTLSKIKLNRDIQEGQNGHDSVEDALAARDLVHAYLNPTN